ncbi:hypothetical protein BRD01_03810 [Halobacteriales archaeon QS_8_65_32]|nr:MAG: hypothetical protein BRD01_03810 [Halobacteriales archaeon QS_8_65_32]
MSTKTISLTIRNQDPTASFEYFPMEPPTGDIVSFSAEASDFDRPNGDLEYEWTFGDGSSGFGPTPQNEYDDEGSYDVTLTVTDEYGASATATRTVTVSNRAPTARIAYGPRAPLTDETVVFDASRSSDPDGDRLTYEWEFGDGNTTISRPTTDHAYGDGGPYDVTLTTIDWDGGRNSTTETIEVSNRSPLMCSTLLMNRSVAICDGRCRIEFASLSG